MTASIVISDRTMAAAAERGVARLETGDWGGPQAPQDFLGVLALRMVLAGYLVGEVERTQVGDALTLTVRLDGARSEGERMAAAKALVLPLGAYAEMADIRVQRETGAVPTPLLILAGVVAVSVVAAQGYVAVVVAEHAAEIIDGSLKRSAASGELQKADAEVLRLVNAHIQREIDAGKTLPLDEATKIALANLSTRANKLVTQAYAGKPGAQFPAWALPTLGLAAAAVVTIVLVTIRKKAEK